MANAVAQQVQDTKETTKGVLAEVKQYTRKAWLAGLGAYAKAGQEGYDYFKELVKTGETVEKDGKKLVNKKIDAVNERVDDLKSDAVQAVEGRLEQIENAFDQRVARALNRLGMPSRHDLDALSVRLEQLSALVEHAVKQKN
ncbi:MAG: phasin family protein [Gammaproteobacteria bacterium]|nr:phasin family protein [Gammaproteobacteria bacterium]